MSFNVPINSIAPIQAPSDWVRPIDWPVITDVAGEVQFLVADTSEKCFSIVTEFTRTSGNIYIDWGDGVTDTISATSATTTSHIYSTVGTPCSRGYNTFKVRVYGDATTTITNCYHFAPVAVNNSPLYNIGLLEAYYGDECCNTSVFKTSLFSSNGAQQSVGTFLYLEYVKLPSVITWNNLFQYFFKSCSSLHKVVMPVSGSSMSSMYQTFQGCTNLRELIFPNNATNIVQYQNLFEGCINLKNVVLPSDMNVATGLDAMFNGCASLQNITLPSINSVSNISSAFLNCYSLQWVKFTSLPTSVATNATSMFQGCVNLQNVYFPSNATSTNIFTGTSMFSGCTNLKNINFPMNFNAITMSSTFQNCYKLTDVVFNSGMSSLSNFSFTFSGCTNLKTVTLPSTISATINLTNMFASCISLESMSIPSAWNIDTIQSMFSGCSNIKTIILPNNAQNSITVMSAAFQNCYKLENLTLPTSLTGVTGLGSIFSNCYNLKSISLPSIMNSCVTINSSFSGCYNLQSITLPTSMNACISFANTFTNCYSLKEVILTSTISATNTSYSSCFSGCTSLASVTFPTTQNTSLTTLTNMFTNCASLKTLVNTDKLGSLTATPLVSSVLGSYITSLQSISFNCPFIRFSISGAVSSKNKLNSVRLLNASSGQYVGTSPQVDVSYCDLGIAALNQLFTDLPTVSGKTINITGTTGAAGCTRTIATLKGWTVTG